LASLIEMLFGPKKALENHGGQRPLRTASEAALPAA
jgi:hypothetical protein